MEEKKPIVTLGQAYEAGWRVNARCSHGKMRGMKSMPECHEQAELDLETLVWTRGEGFPLAGPLVAIEVPKLLVTAHYGLV